MNQISPGKIFGYLLLLGIVIFCVAAFWPAITGSGHLTADWLTNLFSAGDEPHHETLQETMQRYGISGVVPKIEDEVPFDTRVAGWIWQAVGILMAGVVLLLIYFGTAMAGQTQPSGAHGFIGIIVGFTLLIFTTAYLYSGDHTFRFSLLAGVVVSIGLKLFFSYVRIRLRGGARQGPAQMIFFRRVIRRN